MTTVIADLRTLTMGADRLLDHVGVQRSGTKIFKLTTYNSPDELSAKAILLVGQTVLVGISGVLDYSVLICEWVRKGMSPFNDIPRVHSQSEDVEIMVLTSDVLYTVSSEFCPLVVEDFPYYAIGSGRQVAMTALYLGCDIEKALEVSNVIDYYPGGSFDL